MARHLLTHQVGIEEHQIKRENLRAMKITRFGIALTGIVAFPAFGDAIAAPGIYGRQLHPLRAWFDRHADPPETP